MTRIQESFERSPRNATCRASGELGIPQPTVWRALRCRLLFKPYRLQLAQALRLNDKGKRVEFCDRMLQNMEDETFLPLLIFSDEATFHLSGKVNRHNVRIWGLQNPHGALEHERDSPKVNVFCALSQTKVHGPFFFAENAVTGVTYLAMLQNWLLPQMSEDFPTGRSPPHRHRDVRHFLNESVPQRWIGRVGKEDLALQFWPPRFPDLTPCDFFLWGFVKEAVYVPSLPTTLDNLKTRITTAV